MRKIRIGDKIVGHDEPCFIIAEAGSNHNGSLEQAKKLIDVNRCCCRSRSKCREISNIQG